MENEKRGKYKKRKKRVLSLVKCGGAGVEASVFCVPPFTPGYHCIIASGSVEWVVSKERSEEEKKEKKEENLLSPSFHQRKKVE